MFRIGQSRDIHRLEDGNGLVLGLTYIPYTKSIVAHSDGDVLVHAITEAIIGALGLGDLGTFFPDNDEKYRGISSEYFLNEAKKMLKNKEYMICNIDSTILIEKPVLKPYIQMMKAKIASVLEINESMINIKATRGEKLGYIGEQTGVEAMAVVLLEQTK